MPASIYWSCALDFLSVLVIALGLSADCFAVALSGSIALAKPSPVQTLRLALAFGFFQAGMPALGWVLGRTVVNLIAGYDHWVAFGLLAFVGGRMIWESFHPGKDDKPASDINPPPPAASRRPRPAGDAP